jgi:hypothetical protein
VGHDVDYLTVSNVFPIEALTDAERELLGPLSPAPEAGFAELVVYELRDQVGGIQRVVAPRLDGASVGSHVRARRGSATVNSSVTVSAGRVASVTQVGRAFGLELADQAD